MTEVKPKFIDDLAVQEVYAETVQTLFGAPGMMRIQLCVNRWTLEVPISVDRIVPVARFAISHDLARILRDQLTNCLALVEKQDQLVQAPAASPMKN